MTCRKHRSSRSDVWQLAKAQHFVVTRGQLLACGLSRSEIEHRASTGRLFSKGRGIYAVGRPDLSGLGEWMLAVLSCGPHAVLSHLAAAALWGILAFDVAVPQVTVPAGTTRRRPGVRVHRRDLGPADFTRCQGIPVTAPVLTLVDIAAQVSSRRLEAATNEAAKLALIDPETLRAELDRYRRRPGVASLRRLLERQEFVLTDSDLERRFLALTRSAGLSPPETGRRLNGFKVDFLWPDLGLVVETDGLRYHRTAAQQARDRLRDQAHTAAGLTALRFTHAQVAFDRGHVTAILRRVAKRLGRAEGLD